MYLHREQGRRAESWAELRFIKMEKPPCSPNRDEGATSLVIAQWNSPFWMTVCTPGSRLIGLLGFTAGSLHEALVLLYRLDYNEFHWVGWSSLQETLWYIWTNPQLYQDLDIVFVSYCIKRRYGWWLQKRSVERTLFMAECVYHVTPIWYPY